MASTAADKTMNQCEALTGNSHTYVRTESPGGYGAFDSAHALLLALITISF
jgi:hypothetical protein